MTNDTVMDRLRAADPTAAAPREHDALFAQIVAEPGDPRLASAHGARRRSRLARPRVLAGGSLGLAGIAAALVIALGGSAASPAFAITRNDDGSVTVQINRSSGLVDINHRLESMGIDENVGIAMAPGAASTPGAVTCTPAPGVSDLPGPQIKVQVGTDGTEVIAGQNTGAGTWHLHSCGVFHGGSSLATLRGY
jgi:hypothetical protein